MLSILVGILAGLISVLLKNSTHFIQILIEKKILSLENSLYFAIPVIGLFAVYGLTNFVFKKQAESSITLILKSLSKKSGLIHISQGYLPLFLAPITVGFGGSVGLLGPAVGSGASFTSNISSILHLNSKTRILLIGCASAGAISAVFKSPLAGLVFAIEIFSLDLTLTSLLPLLFASVSSIITSYLFLGDEVLFKFEVIEKFSVAEVPFYVSLGIGTAFASIYFSKMYFLIIDFFNRFQSKLKRLIIAGLTIGLLLFFIPPLYGEGLGFINDLLHGDHFNAIGNTPFYVNLDNIWIIILLLIGITIFKAIAMTTTFAAGGVGGIFIPTMVMGSALGNVMAKVVNNLGMEIYISEANYTLLGMAGLIAGVLHAPLTSIFLIAEITTSYELFIPLMITTAISFTISKNSMEHSIYTRELAKQGHLLTHNKDQTVMTLMRLTDYIETNFITVQKEDTLKQLLNKAVSKSNRNFFPVINDKGELEGMISLNDIREIMFDVTLHHTVYVEDLMKPFPVSIKLEEDNVKSVMQKFQDTASWNLPVIKEKKYCGMISKSKLLTAYRRKLINFTT